MKTQLLFQVSVLSEQVNAQKEKIRDLEGLLGQRRNKLNAAEEVGLQTDSLISIHKIVSRERDERREGGERLTKSCKVTAFIFNIYYFLLSSVTFIRCFTPLIRFLGYSSCLWDGSWRSCLKASLSLVFTLQEHVVRSMRPSSPSFRRGWNE